MYFYIYIYMNSFKEFITQFNIIGLAIGFIVAANLKDIAEAIITRFNYAVY